MIWQHEETQHFPCFNFTSLSFSALLVAYLEAFAVGVSH